MPDTEEMAAMMDALIDVLILPGLPLALLVIFWNHWSIRCWLIRALAGKAIIVINADIASGGFGLRLARGRRHLVHKSTFSGFDTAIMVDVE